MTEVASAAASAQQVEAALDALEADGARTYDCTACDCVRALLARAEELGGAVGSILVTRAQAHVQSLSERLVRDRARATAQVEVLEAEHGEQPELRRTLERGDIVRVGRALRRMAVLPIVADAPRRARAVHTESTTRSVSGQKSASSASRGSPRSKRAEDYEDSVAELVASFALARAVDVVPEDAGPYNPLRIASDALDRMRELSPFYLTVQLNRLEELATLLSLPELPGKVEEKVLPKKKRGSLKA